MSLPEITAVSMASWSPPNGVPVLVAGGIAMRKANGDWVSGMENPLFQRPLEWEPRWWAKIPSEN